MKSPMTTGIQTIHGPTIGIIAAMIAINVSKSELFMPAKKKPAPVKTPVTIPITNRPNTTENVTCFDFVINF